MFIKTKDMQRFIREKINFDEKRFLKNIKGTMLPKFCKIKTKLKQPLKNKLLSNIPKQANCF